MRLLTLFTESISTCALDNNMVCEGSIGLYTLPDTTKLVGAERSSICSSSTLSGTFFESLPPGCWKTSSATERLHGSHSRNCEVKKLFVQKKITFFLRKYCQVKVKLIVVLTSMSHTLYCENWSCCFCNAIFCYYRNNGGSSFYFSW